MHMVNRPPQEKGATPRPHARDGAFNFNTGENGDYNVVVNPDIPCSMHCEFRIVATLRPQ